MISAWLAFTLAAKLKGKEEENHFGQTQNGCFFVLLMDTKKLGKALFRAKWWMHGLKYKIVFPSQVSSAEAEKGFSQGMGRR